MESLFRRLACGVVALILLLAAGHAGRRRPSDGLPRLVLWAWERPEDLRQLDAGIGVAFLAQTVTISGDHFAVHPRLQPLRVRAANPLIAVTRIETGGSGPAGLTGAAVDAIASTITRTVTRPRVRAAQIDFDATVSERDFYRALIDRVRRRLNPSMPLSITALASWCVGDDWLDGLPIDEAVPMLFRMGPVNAPFRRLAIREAVPTPSRRDGNCHEQRSRRSTDSSPKVSGRSGRSIGTSRRSRRAALQACRAADLKVRTTSRISSARLCFSVSLGGAWLSTWRASPRPLRPARRTIRTLPEASR
jgi:hypothetical protein